MEAKRYVVLEVTVEVDEHGELTSGSADALLDIEHAVDAIPSQLLGVGGPAYLRSPASMTWKRHRTLRDAVAALNPDPKLCQFCERSSGKAYERMCCIPCANRRGHSAQCRRRRETELRMLGQD